MLQYIINASAIWLMSLILFDIFLRKENFHAYNRFYLLFTLLLGALLPLLQWQDTSQPFSGSFRKPVEQVITAKQTIFTAAVPASVGINWLAALAFLYIVGAAVALVLLTIDFLRLFTYYHNGARSYHEQWTIVTTGKDHAPFSFRNTLYISDRSLYSEEEWRMILDHEKRHTTLLHILDVLLLQSARIVFWFHPLVYFYNKRLLLVHEYQADNAAANHPQEYGSFLVEQSLLIAAPALSHSFNRSPIKNRIMMLTRKSSAASRTKMLVFIPLALVCIVCFSKNGFSQRFEKNGNKVTYRGNSFVLSDMQTDTTFVIDPVTGNEVKKVIKKNPAPISMNGRPIVQDVTEPLRFTGSDGSLRIYLLKNMREELGNLKDGIYRLDISDIVVDESGNIVYFDYHDMKRSKPIEQVTIRNNASAPVIINAADPKIKVTINAGPASTTGIGCRDSTARPVEYTLVRNTDESFYEALPEGDQKAIFNKVCQLLNTAPAFVPATLNSKNVISVYDSGILLWNSFKIKDHKIFDVDPKILDYKELK